MAANARLKIATAVVVLAIGMLTGSSAGFAQTHRFSGFLPSVVNIFVLEITNSSISGSSGSGSVISQKGYIATNNHVIQVGEGQDQHRATDVRVFFSGESIPITPCRASSCGPAKNREMWLAYIERYKKGLKATIEFSDANRDLAVLKTETPIVNPAVTLGTVEPEPSDPVYAVGYPGAAQRAFASTTASPTMTNGTVGRVYTTDNSGSQIKLIQHNAAINPGNSGGPLIDQCERVVGVNTWGATESQGIFYSTSAAELIALLKQHGIPFEASTSSCVDLFGLSSAFGISAKYIKPVLYGLGAVVLVFGFTMLQRRPRKAVLDAASRSVNAVSRRIKPSSQPQHKEAEKFVRFLGYGSAERFSCKIPLETLGRAPNGIVVGRSPESATFVIADGNISRRHALLTLRDGNVALEDLGSTNGTKVNDKALEPNVKCRLREGDKVSFGNLKFEVRL